MCIQARRAERLASITHVHACKAALASAVWRWAWRRRAAVALRGAALAVARRRRLGGLAVGWGRLRQSARVAALGAAATCAARRHGLGRWRTRVAAERAVALGVQLGARWQRRLAFNAWQCGRAARTPRPNPPPHANLAPNQALTLTRSLAPSPTRILRLEASPQPRPPSLTRRGWAWTAERVLVRATSARLAGAVAAGRAALRLRCCLGRWAAWRVVRASLRARRHSLVARHAARQLAAALEDWRGAAQHAMTAIVARWARRGYLRAFAAWAAAAAEAAHAAQLMRGVALRLLHLREAKVLGAWAAAVAAAARQLALLAAGAARHRVTRCGDAWRRWLLGATEAAARATAARWRALLASGAARHRAARCGEAWRQWSLYAAARAAAAAEQHSLLAKGAARHRVTRCGDAWRCWLLCAAEQRAMALMQRAAVALIHCTLARAWRCWAEAAAEATRAWGVLESAARRLRNLGLARAWTSWVTCVAAAATAARLLESAARWRCIARRGTDAAAFEALAAHARITRAAARRLVAVRPLLLALLTATTKIAATIRLLLTTRAILTR